MVIQDGRSLSRTGPGIAALVYFSIILSTMNKHGPNRQRQELATINGQLSQVAEMIEAMLLSRDLPWQR